jgi:hypothetical protein
MIKLKIIHLAFLITFIRSRVISIKWETFITSNSFLYASSKKITHLDGLEHFQLLRQDNKW